MDYLTTSGVAQGSHLGSILFAIQGDSEINALHHRGSGGRENKQYALRYLWSKVCVPENE